ncbi:hypothetical protein [Xanthobacter pseudotagetidis]|uniref:hypothetical protein n=1 Tax=Xanthobacter pseudotagetidis TaxID=3119911 RepID=UPI003727097E
MSSHMTSQPSQAPAPGAAPPPPAHRLRVEAEADPNLLLRLLEPFVIHAVMPSAVTCAADARGLTACLDFAAEPSVAERLRMRLMVTVGVRAAELAPARAPASKAA